MGTNLPFKIVLIAPFAAGLGRQARPLVHVADGDLAAAARKLGENCVIDVSQELLADGRIAVPLLPPDGLIPDAWLARTAPLAQLQQIKDFLQRAEAEQLGAAEVALQLKARWPQKKGSWQHFSATTRSTDADDPLGGLLDLVTLPAQVDSEAQASRSGAVVWRDEVESELRALMEQIVNHPAYRQRLSAWRGASLLTRTGSRPLELLLVDSDIGTLSDTLARINAEVETFAPDLLLVDLPLGCTPRDQSLMGELAEFAEGLLSPLLVGIDASFLGLSSWAELGKLPYLKNHLEQASYAKWRSLHKKSAAHWLSLLVGGFGSGQHEIVCEALPHPLKQLKPLWQNPVWLAAALAVQRYQTSGFPCPVSGEYLACTDVEVSQLEQAFSVDRHAQLVQVGIAPLLEIRRGQLGLAAVPTLGGGTLDQQLFLRHLLSWLFAKQDIIPHDDADTLRQELCEKLTQGGISLPSDLDLYEEEDLLVVHLTPPPELVAAGELIELQLPWK